MIPCILCKNTATSHFFKDLKHIFLICTNCSAIFRDPATFLSAEGEKARYLTHNNDVNDPDYQDFVSPIVDSICRDFTPPSKGLDFGAGTGPVIASMLSDKGYPMALYDPFFHPETKVLDVSYNFIACCEVIEHFYQPLSEFMLLKKLLHPGGKLYCMTDPLAPDKTFADWYYKEDPTHVIFYSDATLQWIKDKVGFSEVDRFARLIVFKK